MERLITIYWRDIPAQVTGRKGRRCTVKKALHPRFEKAIDRAAMRAGRGSSDQYLEDWRRVSQPRGPDPEQAVADDVERLERRLPPDLLDRVVRAGGTANEEGQ